ncbi:SDR family NAD(P)-dependent oxidoreductase [Candidatus Liberibacter asiaticus]|uniref:Oxidoreductase protein n=2 Tax=Liberibacter asiaticus TaxID=34021 RepID=C6XHR7_LIBAP|nr:SDR family NAD(P)-dependent oxidoreductase [Candidatus Liberibacter asiaticus]ACT56810.1 oxidoreductase protein [Candidatus Liberibacter asiaticus str. psy62]AGH16577.1 oxidoreductase protein [Candidatus Liberibacter asiaticus str. gxpsy]ALK06968.1 SDR family NAD(P)-dependent oxidoreductase [Candidatus Liberibacter asiaticus]ASK52438.1 oxidoreductase [Candidatus Liberibacter asiaticus]AWL13765.1 KR domain-containing protein [Candidatus Liberibacter asiaticus]
MIDCESKNNSEIHVNLDNRLALVTGSSRGIGYYTALELARSGAYVIACGRSISQLEKLKNALQKINKKIDIFAFDLRDSNALELTKTYIAKRWGKLDILIANAGILGSISPIWQIKEKSFADVISVNVMANWNIMRSFDPWLKKSHCGRAIILSSGAAYKCRPLWGAYSASKAAIEALARTWSKETVNTALRVINIDPGPTRTSMRAKAMPAEDPNTVPHPQKVAKIISFLCATQKIETGKLFSVPQNRFVNYLTPN